MAAIVKPVRLSVAVERSPFGDVETQMPAATHTNVAIHLTGQSVLEWTPDSRTLSGRPTRGMMTIVPQGRSGRLRVSGGAFEVLKIGIPGEAFVGWAEGAEQAWTGAPLLDRFIRRDPLVEQISLNLLRSMERPGSVDSLYQDALSIALIAHLVRHHGDVELGKEPQRRLIHALSPSRMRRCLDLMEADLTRAIGIGDIARELDLSASHFSAQFTQAFGRSPARYLTWLRLERARTLLENTREPIGDIASRVGFTSTSHFSQAFRAEYNDTPSRWRATRG